LPGPAPTSQSRGWWHDVSATPPLESFFATLKAELIGQTLFANRPHSHDDIFRFIEGFYAAHRLYRGIGYQSPVQAEAGAVPRSFTTVREFWA
jgi:hypothetical protein